ncbi:hypothetical protein LJC71_07070 [Desulfosarcina sp. OttesenSCG-928-A07]|nr:hypothetical protein [Desulfosarcina sp. OttesenSCG-928-G17]MDL2329486.1 hypothetical protein [Desulfosarcina sp. OttesenSCG-928-A07]
MNPTRLCPDPGGLLCSIEPKHFTIGWSDYFFRNHFPLWLTNPIERNARLKCFIKYSALFGNNRTRAIGPAMEILNKTAKGVNIFKETGAFSFSRLLWGLAFVFSGPSETRRPKSL